LVRLVWGDGWFGDDNNVAVHVSKLRRKLGESGLHPRFIRTVRSVGYRFDPR
jgi:DNA-binding response OmpR family regulator